MVSGRWSGWAVVPSASPVDDLPGYSPRLRTGRPSPSSGPSLLAVCLAFALILGTAEGCHPWLRSERSVPAPPPPVALQLNSTDVDPFEEYADYFNEKPQTIECEEHLRLGYCRNNGKCIKHFSAITESYHPACNCAPGFRGEICDEPSDPNVFAAQLLGRRGNGSAPLAVLAFFCVLAILTLGAALFVYRKVLSDRSWPEKERSCSDTPRTPFSCSAPSLHRRLALHSKATSRLPSNALSRTGGSPSNLNPCLTPSGGLWGGVAVGGALELTVTPPVALLSVPEDPSIHRV